MPPVELTPSSLPAYALITGGARRIGAAFARALAARGWGIILHCNRSRNEAEALVPELQTLSGMPVHIIVQDLQSADAGESVFQQCPHAPTLLINNASLFDLDELEDFTVAQWDRHMDVNLRAPTLLTRAFAARRPEGAGGLIVNILDAKLSALNPDYFSYTISKIALAGVTELSARALAPHIRVNGIAPSVTLVSGAHSRANFDEVHRLNALHRGVEAAHLVAALEYLIATPTVTGQILELDAGKRFLGLSRDIV